MTWQCRNGNLNAGKSHSEQDCYNQRQYKRKGLYIETVRLLSIPIVKEFGLTRYPIAIPVIIAITLTKENNVTVDISPAGGNRGLAAW